VAETVAFPHLSLLKWFKQHARDLPWRQNYDPYQVLISEMMLQQTQIVTALPYFNKWVNKWPNFNSLADATEEEVLHAWEGLGYYQRARRLHQLARTLKTEFAGILPMKEDELLQLPGLGPYTAAAVSAIAYNQSSFPIDGNVRRVLSRFFCEDTPSPHPRQDAFFFAEILPSFKKTTKKRELAQAFMELGATVCSPKKPDCANCPIQKQCASSSPETALNYPKKKKKTKPKPLHLCYVWVITPHGVLLRQRPPDGRFPAQWEPLCVESPSEEKSKRQLQGLLGPLKVQWLPPFRRDFTTFHVQWHEGYCSSDTIANIGKEYSPFKPSEVQGLNLVPVMAKTWRSDFF
jgi:A/G-specific adenine glycosylase